MNPLNLWKALTATVGICLPMALHAQCLVNSAPANTCTTDHITAFTLNSISASGNNGCSGGGYGQFTSPVWVLEQGQTYTWNIVAVSGTGGQGVAIWLDVNGNGIFEASEMLAASTVPMLNHTGNLTIPLTAVAGDSVHMRIRCARNSTFSGTDACTANMGGFGETEDYFVQIICTPANYITVDIGNDTLHCDEMPLDAGYPGSAYTWSTGDTAQTIVADTTGLYWVQVTSPLGCTDSDTIGIGIDPPSEAGTPMVTDYSVCVGQQGVLMITTGYTGQISWSAINPNNELNLIGNGTPYDYGSPSLQDTGVYAVFCIALSGVCPPDFSDTLYVTIVPPPVVDFTLTAALDTVLLMQGPVALSGGTPPGGVYTGPGVSGGMFDPMAVGEGTFQLIYTYNDTSGCSSADTTTILVLDDTGLSPSGSLHGPGVYPNPGAGVVYLDAPAETGPVEWWVTDLAGRVVQTGYSMAFTGPCELNVSALAPGEYIFLFRTALGPYRQKWIKVPQ